MRSERNIEAAKAPRTGLRPGDKGFEAWGDDVYYYWNPAEMSDRKRSSRAARSIAGAFAFTSAVAGASVIALTVADWLGVL